MKKRIITKRILVIALTLITMFNSIPITAFASDDAGNEVISEEVSNNDDASDESGSDDSSDLLLKVAEDGNNDSNDQGGVPERFDGITSGVVPSSDGGEIQGDEINGGNGDDVVLPNADGGDDGEGEGTGGFPAEVTPTYEPIMCTVHFTEGQGYVTESGSISDISVMQGTIITLPECTYVKPGYDFAGWYCNRENYKAGDSFIVENLESNMVAKFEPKYSSFNVKVEANIDDFSYEINEDGFGTKVEKFVYGVPYTISISSSKELIGYSENGLSILFEDIKIDEDTGKYEYRFKVYENTRIYLTFKTDEYVTVNFDSNGGYNEMSSITCYKNQTVDVPSCNFRKTGYVFDYWSVNGTKIDGNTFTVGNTDITLVANWREASQYSFNLEVKNDTGIVTNTTIGLYVFDQEKGSFKQVDGPVSEGAYLAINIDRDNSDKDLEYVLTVDGKEIVGDATYIYMPNHDVDVKLEIKSATPKFTVTFDYSEDHPDLISDSWKVEANETIDLPDYWAFNNDLTFSGWLIDGKLYKAWSSYTVTKDVTVVAKFNIKPLSININGQEIASNLLPGDTFTFPEFNGEITNGYIFDSYTYKGDKYKPGDTIVVSADTSASFIDIYVNYLKIVKCEVKSSDDQVAKNVRIFDEDGNELSTLIEGTQVKIYVDSDAPIESIKVNNNKFTGSNLYKEGDYTYVKYVIPYVETLTIDIKYMPLVTITFDTDGGEPLEPITGYKGETLKLPVPIKDGYLFRTWSNNGSNYDTIILDKDLTFKAYWYKLLNYTVSVTNDEDVTYEVYIGDYQRDERVEYVQEKSAYDIVVIVPNGDIVANIDAKNVRFVEFEGMYNDYYYARLTTSNDDFEIIVEFKEKETLIFDTDGGSSVDPIKWYEDEPMILPLEPTKDGYEFLGWEIDGKTFDAGGDYVMHKSTTAKALWKLITYKITFDCNYPEASLVPNVNGKSGRYDITQIVPGSIFKMNLRNYEAGYVLTGLEMDGVAIEDNFRTEYTMPNHDVVVKVTFTKLIDIPYEVTTNMDIDFNYSMYTYPTLQEVTNGNITMNSNYCLAFTFDEHLFSIDNVTVDGTELKTYNKNDKTYYRLTAPISDKASIKVNFKFNKATITFDANGGNGTMTPISENIGTKVTLPISTFTRTGYKFKGWTLDDKIVTEITLDDDVTVKASWEKVKEDTKPSNNNNDGNNSNNNNNNNNSNVTNDGTNKTNETTTISQLVVPANNPVATQVNANNNVNVNANQEVNEVTTEDEDVTVDNTTETTESNVTTNTDGESNDGNTVVTNGNEGSNDDSDNGTFIEDNKTNDGMDKNTISTIITAFLAVAWPWILGSTVTLVGIGVAVKVVSIKKKGRR